MFNRLRSTEPVSFGVNFFRASGLLISMSNQFLAKHKIIMEGFIVGVLVNNLLHPIYDRHRQGVVIRISDLMNIPLDAFDAMEIPFYKQVHPSFLPHPLQPGEGSSRGNN